jgi:hypothetical protein
MVIKEKISIYIILYYDLDFLDDILQYLNTYIDEIIIVDGPYQYSIDTLDKLNLLYTEETKPDKLSKIIDKYENKIKYYYGTWKDEKEKRMFGYSKCTNNLILLVDCDEFFILNENKINKFIDSDKCVAGFDIYNMNRINVNMDDKSTKNILFKKNITAHQHLSYTWLICVDNLEEQNTNYILINDTMGTIYHQTLNRIKFNNIIKYIFYITLNYYNKNTSSNNIINGYDINVLLETLSINDITNIFYHSKKELIGIPENRVLVENTNVLINLDKYKDNHNEGYATNKTIVLKNVEYYCFIKNNSTITFQNITNVKLDVYEINLNKPYIIHTYNYKNVDTIEINNINQSNFCNMICINCSEPDTNNFVYNITINDLIKYNDKLYTEIIPFGEECYTCESIHNKFNNVNIRNKSFPFDYVGHTYIYVLSNKLNNYELLTKNDIHIQEFSNKYYYVDTKYGFKYWHDISYNSPLEFTDIDMDTFITKYNRRYKRLIDNLQSNHNILCISVCHYDDIYNNKYKKNEVYDLYAAIKKYNKKVTLLAINYYNEQFSDFDNNLIHVVLSYTKTNNFVESKQNFTSSLFNYIKNNIIH